MDIKLQEDMRNDIPKEPVEDDIIRESKDKNIEVQVTSLDYGSSNGRICKSNDQCKKDQLMEDTDNAPNEGKAVESVVFWRLSYHLASLLEQPFIECLSQALE
jgi:hypothetical protein